MEGLAQNVVCSPLTCLIAFEPGFAGLVVSIPGASLDRFPPPKETYAERRIRVRGRIVDRGGRLRIELDDPAQISVVGGDAAPAARSASTAGSRVVTQPKTSSRVVSDPKDASDPQGAPKPVVQTYTGGVQPGSGGMQVTSSVAPAGAGNVDQIVRDLNEEASAPPPPVPATGLPARMDEQERIIEGLEQEIGTLQERVVELETAPRDDAFGSSAVPRIEPYVATARSRLNPVKVRTGWSTGRLVRTLGQPYRVDPLPMGGALWVYTEGRSVTVDAGGRVVSTSGF